MSLIWFAVLGTLDFLGAGEEAFAEEEATPVLRSLIAVLMLSISSLMDWKLSSVSCLFSSIRALLPAMSSSRWSSNSDFVSLFKATSSELFFHSFDSRISMFSYKLASPSSLLAFS